MNNGKGKRIESIVTQRIVDDDPDYSWIGEYTDEVDDNHIDVESGEYIRDLPCVCGKSREEHAESSDEEDVCTIDDFDQRLPERGREYRFFKPYAGGEKPGTDDYRTYGLQDFKRMQDYNRQEWCFVGVKAEAEIIVNGVCQTIHSGGLWEIESDSDDEHFREVEDEELRDVREQLRQLGFSKRAVDTALSKAERGDL